MPVKKRDMFDAIIRKRYYASKTFTLNRMALLP